MQRSADVSTLTLEVTHSSGGRIFFFLFFYLKFNPEKSPSAVGRCAAVIYASLLLYPNPPTSPPPPSMFNTCLKRFPPLTGSQAAVTSQGAHLRSYPHLTAVSRQGVVRNYRRSRSLCATLLLWVWFLARCRWLTALPQSVVFFISETRSHWVGQVSCAVEDVLACE